MGLGALCDAATTPCELVNSVMMSPHPPWDADQAAENRVGHARHGRQHGGRLYPGASDLESFGNIKLSLYINHFSVLQSHPPKLSWRKTRLITKGERSYEHQSSVGCLGGLLAATGVFYVQSHRNAKTEAPTPVAAVAAPAVAPTPPPAVEKPAPAKVEAPAPPPKKVVAKKLPKPAVPEVAPDPLQQTKVEAPPHQNLRPLQLSLRSDPRRLRQPSSASAARRDHTRAATAAIGHHREWDAGHRPAGRNDIHRTKPARRRVPGHARRAVGGGRIGDRGERIRASGRVVDTVEAGRVKGLAHLSLELANVMLSDGQKVELRTARFEKEGPSSKTEDTQKVGIGAAIGAVIGAIAGGGKGAAIGAASGGAAGGGVAAATRGKPAVIPAETKISFRVEQPVTVTEQR